MRTSYEPKGVRTSDTDRIKDSKIGLGGGADVSEE